LIGESYGTTRACLVADILGDRFVLLNGLVLIAPVLDYQNSRPQRGDGGILSYASFLPTYAAVAWFHHKVTRDGMALPQFLEEVRRFARTEYAQALIANDSRLTAEQRSHLVARLAEYTGLKEAYIRQSKFRIPVQRFFKELLRDEEQIIGRLDGRYTSREAESAGEAAESDPAFDAIGGALTSALNSWFAELGLKMDRPYVSMKDIEGWNWVLQGKVPNGGGYISAIPHLGRAMRRNQALRVLVASGYYDLATPFFGAENALSQDGVVHDRITFTYYEAGHMIFLHEPSRCRFLEDIRQFTHSGVKCPRA
jgi:carboxypeptidase C (cathepsin A)